MANNAFTLGGATPGVYKPKAMNPAMYGGGSVSIGGQPIGGSFNPNQGAISLGSNQGLIQQNKPKNVLDNFGSGNKDVKSITQPDGTKIDLYSDNKDTKGTTKPTTPTPTTPQVGSSTQNAQGLLNTGQQTPLEQTAFQNLQQAGQMSPQEQAANAEVRKANELQKSYQNVGQLAPYAEAGMYSDRARTPEEIQAIQQAPDLAGRAASTYGLTNSLSNIYGSSRVAGANAALQGTQTAAQRGLGAAQSGLVGAQAQAGRAQGVAGSVLSASMPTQVSPTNVPFNPLTGTYGQPASSAYGANGLAGIGGLLEQQNQGAQTQNMIGAFNQAKPLIETAKQQIASSGFNVNPLGLANALSQWVNKDVVPSGEYANLFNTLSEIATTISPVLGAQGAQTNLKTMIAQEFIPRLMQGSQISSVLDNIEKNALAKIEAQKSTAQGKPLQTPTLGTQGSGGTVSAGGYNFKLVNGQYVPI